LRHHGKPPRFGDVDGAHEEEAYQQQQAGGHEHHERDQLVLQVARLLVHSPRVVHRGRDRAEHAHRGPDHQEAAGHAELNARLLERIQLVVTKSNGGKVPEDEIEDGHPIGRVGGHAPEDREHQQQEGKEREQRVIRDRRREGEIVAVVKADDAAPDSQERQADLRDDPERHAAHASHRVILLGRAPGLAACRRLLSGDDCPKILISRS
jgi:hypothetical protein